MVLSRAGDAKRNRVIHRSPEFGFIVLKVIIVRFLGPKPFLSILSKEREMP